MGISDSKTVSTKQNQIAELARKLEGKAIWSLNHYLDMEWLKEAYRRTRKDGASGIDGKTAEEYAENLEENLRSLLERAKSGLYFAPPVKRVYIPKAGSKAEKRPIGIPTFEDKVLQRAVGMILEPIFETKFRDCSYGFRPKRSQHKALEAMWEATMNAPRGWVIDLDIKGYFDHIDKKQLKAFLEEWVQDRVIIRLIGKWLRAGVSELNVNTYSETGVPQGGVISPMLSNLYLHHVLDSWIEDTVQPMLKGKVALIRFADDAQIIFQNKEDALRVYKVIGKRLEKFGLELHPDKTKLIKFQKPKGPNDNNQSENHIDFLGFTHYWGKSRRNNWVVKRKTQKQRLKGALRNMKEWCRKNRHEKLSVQREALTLKLNGHYSYYGITGNIRSLKIVRKYTVRIWRKWLSRRDRSYKISWDKMHRILHRYPLPPVRIVHSVM